MLYTVSYCGSRCSCDVIPSVTSRNDIPGPSLRSAGPGQTEYEARGLASSGGSPPTVGFYLDEVPLSPPVTSQIGKVVIDPNLYDIDRIELLRGPKARRCAGSVASCLRSWQCAHGACTTNSSTPIPYHEADVTRRHSHILPRPGPAMCSFSNPEFHLRA